jgi:hypothetical protein
LTALARQRGGSEARLAGDFVLGAFEREEGIGGRVEAVDAFLLQHDAGRLSPDFDDVGLVH